MLTPADVEQKTFSTALRGYDLDEVDDFLDEVVATIKELNEQLEEARVAARESASGPGEPETELEPAAAPEPEPEQAAEPARPDLDESAIGRALVAAQTAADRLLEEAESEASRIVEEAKTEADSWSEEREAKRREAEVEISSLAARVAAVRSELAVLAGEVSEKLDDMDAVIESSAETGESEPDQDGDVADSADSVDSPDDGPSSDEPGGEPEENEGSDHLDEMLTGVATDLQLRSDDDGEGYSEQTDDEDE